jgi:hypothetical protein
MNEDCYLSMFTVCGLLCRNLSAVTTDDFKKRSRESNPLLPEYAAGISTPKRTWVLCRVLITALSVLHEVFTSGKGRCESRRSQKENLLRTEAGATRHSPLATSGSQQLV